MIHLKNITEGDAPIIFTWKNDTYLKRMALDHDSVVTLESQENDIKRAINSEYAEYKLIEYNGIFVGYIRIDWMDESKKVAWLRFALGEKRGNGIMQEALKLFMDELKKNQTHRIECEVYEINIPSIKLLKNLGFEIEGTKRKAHFDGTKYIDVYVFGYLF